MARGRRADALGRGEPGQPRHLLLGAARAGRGRVRLRAARPGDRRCCTTTASRSISRRPPRHHRRGSRRATRTRCRSTPMACGAASARGRHTARPPRNTAPQRPRSPGRSRERFADHPAVVMWHVNNEYGCHNWHCFCDVSAAAFRVWLQAPVRDARRAQRGMGHRVLEPALHRLGPNQPAARGRVQQLRQPGQQLDFWRFSSDELLGLLPGRGRCRPRRRHAAGHHELHELLQAAGLPALGRRAGRDLQRPLPDRRRRRPAAAPGR